jgi:hypothetical protein
MAVKYTNIVPFQGPPKYTQIGIFGMKIYHLADLFLSATRKVESFFIQMSNLLMKHPHIWQSAFKIIFFVIIFYELGEEQFLSRVIDIL